MNGRPSLAGPKQPIGHGAGKTTIISMVAGLIPANGGTVRVAGRAMTPTETEAKRIIGLVPQELAIYPDLTARENLKFFGRLQGLSGRELTRRTNEVLELIGLSDRTGDLTKGPPRCSRWALGSCGEASTGPCSAAHTPGQPGAPAT